MNGAHLTLNGEGLLADPAGALYWPARRLLAVADLHLEKGSGFAARGNALLPPYDSRATLAALARLVRHYDPKTVVSLGDSFHDGGAPARLVAADAAALKRLTGAVDWVWAAGNHDPAPPEGFGGRVVEELVLDRLRFRHEAAAETLASGEVSGHYHPKALVQTRGRRIGGRCFATDGRRLVLPSFGAYTGGLDVLDPALTALFGPALKILLLRRGRIYAFGRRQLVPPPEPYRLAAGD